MTWLKTLVSKAFTALRIVIPIAKSLHDAPAEVQAVLQSVTDFESCLSCLVDLVSSEWSLLSQCAEKELKALRPLLIRLTNNFDHVFAVLKRYTTREENGRVAWIPGFNGLANRISWTVSGGSVQALAAQLKSDYEVVNSLVNILQTRTIVDLKRMLGNLPQDIQRLEAKLDSIAELLGAITGTPPNSLQSIFSPPPYNEATPSEALGSLSLDVTTFHCEIPNQGFENLNTSRTTLIGRDDIQTSLGAIDCNTRITVTEFLWRLAKQAATEQPWKPGIRISDCDDESQAEYHLSNCVGDLMELCNQDVVRTRHWSHLSLQSWLYAGAWYLASARVGMKLSRISENRKQLIESFVSLVKVFWILLTIDQHPQKPVYQDEGLPNREYEQLTHLASATTSECQSASLMLEARLSVKEIAQMFEDNLGSIWEFDKDDPYDDPNGYYIALYASSILEHPEFITLAVSTDSAARKRGKFRTLCSNCLFILPKKHNYLRGEPPLFACGCAGSKHLEQLMHVRFNLWTEVVPVHSSVTDLLVSKLTDAGPIALGNASIAMKCPSEEVAKAIVVRMVETRERILNGGTITKSWNLNSIDGDRTLRVVRSPFDNARPGDAFMKPLNNIEHKAWKKTRKVRRERQRTAADAAQEEADASFWEKLWGNVPRRRYYVEEDEEYSDEELKEKLMPKPKPPDYTIVKAMGPLRLEIREVSEGFIVSLISPGTLFEASFPFDVLNFDNKPGTQFQMSKAPDSSGNLLTMSLSWKHLSDSHEFGQLSCVYRTFPLHRQNPVKLKHCRGFELSLGPRIHYTSLTFVGLDEARRGPVYIIGWSNLDYSVAFVSRMNRKPFLWPGEVARLQIPVVTLGQSFGTDGAEFIEIPEEEEVLSTCDEEMEQLLTWASVGNLPTVTRLPVVRIEFKGHKDRNKWGMKSSSTCPPPFTLSVEVYMDIWPHNTGTKHLILYGWREGGVSWAEAQVVEILHGNTSRFTSIESEEMKLVISSATFTGDRGQIPQVPSDLFVKENGKRGSRSIAQKSFTGWTGRWSFYFASNGERDSVRSVLLA